MHETELAWNACGAATRTAVGAAAATAALIPWVDRLFGRLNHIVFVLRNDTTGVDERWRLIPILLGAWLLASLLATPACWVLARLMGGSDPWTGVARVALGVAFVQVLLFGVHWGLIAWGNRQLDWSMFGASVVAAALVVRWAWDRSYGACMLYVIGQSALALALLIAFACGAGELGWLRF